MEDFHKKAILEALLFVSGEPATLTSLAKATEWAEQDVKRLLNELSSEYKLRNSG
ncbi:MAG: SMC-Scp complex subunit ScpB, partial [Nitrospirae bacterium]|nr:SMC-Scp complex subunit ScpB [Nitrospirota bacterium]